MTARVGTLRLVLALGACGCEYDWSLAPPGPDRTADAGLVDGGAGDATSGPDASTGSAYRAAVLRDAPIFYWRLGESAGTSAFDEVPRASDATYEGAFSLLQPGALAGDANTAVRLDGASGCIDAGLAGDFTGASAFTLEAWIASSAITDGSYRRIFNKQSTDGSQSYSVALTATNLLFQRYVDGAQKAVEIAPPAADVYTYVVATYDGATLRLYGESAAGLVTNAIADTRAIPSIPAPLEVGCRPSVPTTYFDGRLDEVAIYAHALAGPDVTRHYGVGSRASAGD